MGAKMYRGIKLNDLPPELWEHIRRHLRIPYDESEVGQHFKIGPVLLDHIENSHWEQGREDFAGVETANLGRNWTLNRSWAEKASSPNTGRCEFPVLLEADMPTNPDAFDPNNNNEDQRVMNSEQQVTPIPGAPLNVTGVKVRDGQEWLEVLNDPEYVARRSKEYPSVAEHHTGPQVRIAMASPAENVDRFFFSFSPSSYTYRGPKVRPAPPRPEGFVDESDYNFTGTMDTQYHHRSITPEVDDDIDRRKDSIDDYYEEMRQRKDSGLEPIPWKEWLNRTAFIHNAMAWDEWADKVKHEPDAQDERYGRYLVPQAGAFLDYMHTKRKGTPVLWISGIYTHPDNRKDGVAEAMVRRLSEDHPGIPIYPGVMTNEGQAFHDRMLDKDPEAKSLITAREWGHL